ncbi:ABC transporter ATP-binding protein [Salipiger sp. P9]|uniref:ABC transporter ATP-binding protein n=1 Tax=Salipiger pentaromativorans TaxID=2943193 RepID=UPI0021577FE6|nr:ABC transporter ATP-binding protein [Salipiger pentaromativorans]MCR8548147.1 ABC transporter ATP-binding protein [Salipiger pentaromativorans]
MIGAPKEVHVSLSGVLKTYDGQHYVVRDLDLEVYKGEFLTLLGPSGSGKTTTLMMLAGFEHPTDGAILLDGRPVHNIPPEKRNFGVVFQSYALFPHMTVAENVGYSLRVRGTAKDETARRVAGTLEAMRLSDFAQRYPTALSGGQQQRVALARALVFEPDLVLMDEPLGALDKRLREELQLEIRSIAERFGLTVIYVTHDQEEALTMSDRIAVFNNGYIQQIGPAEEIYSRPVNRFVAGFVGDNNGLDATVTSVEGDLAQARLRGGAEVVARTTSHTRAGAPATISIRPELIVPLKEARPGALSGTVSNVVYTGDQLRIYATLPGGDEVVVKRPTSATDVPTEIGAPVHLYWDPTSAWALDGQ